MAQSTNPTGTPLNLLYINCSPPAALSEAEWERWLISSHIPTIISSGTVTRAAVYKEVAFGMIPKPTHPLQYMVLYQTDFKRLQDSDKYRYVCQESGAGKFESTNHEVRNYKLIQDYDPFDVDGRPGPRLLTVEMHPEDREDFEDWYRKDLLPKLSTLPGYRRCKRYEITPSGSDSNHYLAIHELDNLSKAFRSQEQHEEASTPRMEKHIEASEQKKTDRGSGFVRRGWILVHAQGYQSVSDEIPAKLEEINDSEVSDDGGCLGIRRMMSRLFRLGGRK